MKSIEVDNDTYERLQFAARIAGTTVPDVVRRLVRSPASGPAAAEAATGTSESEVPVFVSYLGSRVEGLLDLETDRLRITNGPEELIGQAFKSPTNAAVEVVKTVNPDRERPETNGWRFWRAAESGQIIGRAYRR